MPSSGQAEMTNTNTTQSLGPTYQTAPAWPSYSPPYPVDQAGGARRGMTTVPFGYNNSGIENYGPNVSNTQVPSTLAPRYAHEEYAQEQTSLRPGPVPEGPQPSSKSVTRVRVAHTDHPSVAIQGWNSRYRNASTGWVAENSPVGQGHAISREGSSVECTRHHSLPSLSQTDVAQYVTCTQSGGQPSTAAYVLEAPNAAGYTSRDVPSPAYGPHGSVSTMPLGIARTAPATNEYAYGINTSQGPVYGGSSDAVGSQYGAGYGRADLPPDEYGRAPRQ